MRSPRDKNELIFFFYLILFIVNCGFATVFGVPTAFKATAYQTLLWAAGVHR